MKCPITGARRAARGHVDEGLEWRTEKKERWPWEEKTVKKDKQESRELKRDAGIEEME